MMVVAGCWLSVRLLTRFDSIRFDSIRFGLVFVSVKVD